MPVTHTNRKGDTYYLHVGRTRTGKPRYTFSKKAEGNLVSEIPDGYEIYENPHAQVFLRKRQRSRIRDEEVAACRDGLARWCSLPSHACIVERRKDSIEVFTLDGNMTAVAALLGRVGRKERPEDVARRYGTYRPMMRFVLVDESARAFVAERRCFLGSGEDWLFIGGLDTLDALLEAFVPHLGQDSFYELL